MKLVAGKHKYRLPPVGQVVSATVVLPAAGAGSESRIDLTEVDLRKLAETVSLNPRVGADTPAFYAHDGEDLHVWPTPHRSGVLIVRYYPPMETA